MISSRTLAQTALSLNHTHGEEKTADMLLEYLKTHNLTMLLPEIIHHIKQKASTEHDHIIHVHTPRPLSKDDKEKIRSLLDAQDAVWEEHIDETLIGGYTIFFRGVVYHVSIKHTLTKLNTLLRSQR